MTFEHLLQALALETQLDLHEAVVSGGCTIKLDNHIELTLEQHEQQIYMFAPVITLDVNSPPELFSFLLQIQLLGIATDQCWFGYNAAGQTILLFCVISLEQYQVKEAVERIERLVEQVERWQKELPQLCQNLEQEQKQGSRAKPVVANGPGKWL